MKSTDTSGSDRELAQAYRTAFLIAGFIRKTLTPEEHDELDGWVAASEENSRLFEELTDEKNLEKSLAHYEKLDKEAALKKVKSKLDFTKPRLSGAFPRLWKYAVAASILIIAGAVIYIYVNNPTPDKDGNEKLINTQDVAPGSDKATLTLSNGSVIALDTAGSSLHTLGISKKDGEVDYNEISENSNGYHTLSVPKKGRYRLVLEDGSRVWLNAESSITYPVKFTGKERNVQVTGEVYFEVFKDKSRPFKVEAGESKIEVLGTEFNVNDYANEPALSTTLVEGSVKIINKETPYKLKPGQQAEIFPEGNVRINDANIEEVTAWKKDVFKFVNQDIKTIMRQVQRWYGVEVVYADSIPNHFYAEISRNTPVSKLLHYLESTKRVHFKIEDNKIFVMK
jgi:transmembrane sensor